MLSRLLGRGIANRLRIVSRFCTAANPKGEVATVHDDTPVHLRPYDPKKYEVISSKLKVFPMLLD
jgi:hypothetical protein